MEVLFNKADQGSAEIKALAGWLNTTLKYDRLSSDIDLETPRLIEFIGKNTYKRLVTEYTGQPDDSVLDAIKYAQLYILCMAYLSYARNNDLQHGSTGRKQYKADNESAPWEWQVKADEGATMRRAYKALDRLIDTLESNEITEWLASEQRATSRKLLITTTDAFDKIYSIDNSGQLYYRLVPTMQAVETEFVNPLLDAATLTRLKTATDLTDEENLLKLHAQRITAFYSLAKAYQTFPLEMFAGNIDYAAGANYKHTVTSNKIIWFQEEAQTFSLALQNTYQRYKGIEETYALPDNSDTSKRFANL